MKLFEISTNILHFIVWTIYYIPLALVLHIGPAHGHIANLMAFENCSLCLKSCFQLQNQMEF
jgi:hypothetical protein